MQLLSRLRDRSKFTGGEGSTLASAGWLAFFFIVAVTGGPAWTQSLSVMPVTIQLLPAQKTTTLTVANSGETDTSIQVRAYTWSQPGGSDQLLASDGILVSPPLATIAPGGKQIIRLVLRRQPKEQEDTYRILLDQIPPPAVPGVVRVVLRMSIPIFAEPKEHASSRVSFRVERRAAKMYLMATNEGISHETIHSLDLRTHGGLKLKTDFDGSQYVLAGATRRWLISAQDSPILPGEVLRLTAITLAGPIQQQVHLIDTP